MLATLLIVARVGRSGLPPFSWDTLPVAFHSCNSTAPWTADKIEELARYSMV